MEDDALLSFLDIDALMEAIDKETSDNRFAFLNDDKLQEMSKRIYSENTVRRITSVVKLFNDWRNSRNGR